MVDGLRCMEPGTRRGASTPPFATTVPIFDRHGKVFGYEVDFRFGFEAELAECPDTAPGTDFWRAMGLEEILGLAKAYIVLSRDLVTKMVPVLFPAHTMIIGLPGDVADDDELIRACKLLKESGYALAIDGFRAKQMESPFLEFGDVVRVDAAATPDAEQEQICRDLTAMGISPWASKVDSPERFKQAMEMGYWHFQGDFFRRPVLGANREVLTSKALHLQLLNQVNKPELAYDELEAIIKQDVSMTYRLLRFMNSAWFGLRTSVDSIRHALVLLGPPLVRTWASALVLREVSRDKPDELFRRSLIRARMAEALAPELGMRSHACELFLMGMLSLVDALTDVPMARVLGALPVSQRIKTALLGGGGEFGTVLDLVLSYELGRWDMFAWDAASLGLDENAVPRAFVASSHWADKALSAMP